MRLQKGELDLREVELELEEKITPTVEVFSSAGLEEMGFNFKEALGQLFPRKTRKRKIKVAIAAVLKDEGYILGSRVTDLGGGTRSPDASDQP